MGMFFKKFLFTTVCIIVILYLSLANFSSVELPPKIPHLDKIVHFIMYAGFTFCVIFDLTRDTTEHKIKFSKAILAFVFTSVFGMLMECAQYTLTTYRGFELADMISNSLGALCGAVFSYYFVPVLLKWLKIK